MSKKIIFQKCNFNNIYFLLYIIFFVLNNVLSKQLDVGDFEDKNFKNFFLSAQIIITYTSNISDFIAIIPYFIIKKLLKKHKENNSKTESTDNESKNSENNSSLLIYNDSKIYEFQKKKKLLLFYFILVAFFDFMKNLMEIFNYIISQDQYFSLYAFSFTVIFDIILQFIFSYIILKVHFYKLQYMSLFLNIAIFLIILTIDFCNYFLYKSFEWQMFILFPAYLFFDCLKFIYGKKLILYGYVSLYLLIIIKGVLKLIMMIFFSFIFYFVNKEVMIDILFIIKKGKYILLIILYIIDEFLMNTFLWIIIDKFCPNYVPLVLILEEPINFIFEKIDGDEYDIMGWDLYVRMFLYIISFIGVIIHNEIVIINICELGSDTKYFLDLKVINEEIYSNEDNPEILKRYETLTEMEEKNDETVINESESNNQNNNN